MAFSLLYTLVFFLLFLAYLPLLIYSVLFKGKYRQSLWQRLGFGLPQPSGASLAQRPYLWAHAVSMGETKALVPILEKIHARYPSLRFVISTTTETGQQEAKRLLPFVDTFLYLPFDHTYTLSKLMEAFKPQWVLLSETDFWFQFLWQAKKRGASVILVNGKLSTRSLKRYQQASFFTHQLLKQVDLFCVQASTYAQRFQQLGVENCKLLVTGNTKIDLKVPYLKDKQAFKTTWGLLKQHKVLVFGSTHEGEESLALEVYRYLLAKNLPLKLLIVPRHPGRFERVATLLQEQQLPFVKSSSFQQGTEPKEASIILVDEMGILSHCYEVADLAVVCGSFTEKVGGHNLYEPLPYGVPVLFGPYTFTQKGAKELIEDYQAGKASEAQELKKDIYHYLTHQKTWEKASQGGQALIAEAKGASDKTFQALQRYFEENNSLCK